MLGRDWAGALTSLSPPFSFLDGGLGALPLSGCPPIIWVDKDRSLPRVPTVSQGLLVRPWEER